MSGKINYEKVENELEDLLVLKQAVEDLLEANMALQDARYAKLKTNFDHANGGVKSKLSKIGFRFHTVAEEDVLEAYSAYTTEHHKFEAVLAELNHKRVNA